MTDKAREVSITGCLSKGADGKFMLTNARVDNPAGNTSTATGTTGTSTSPPATTTPGTTATGTTAANAAANAAAMSWALMGGDDLEKHVGHKIQVTGRAAWDSAMDRSRAPDTTSAAAGTTAGTAGTTAGTTGTSGTTTTAAVEEARKAMRADQPSLDVQTVKMIAPSCS